MASYEYTNLRIDSSTKNSYIRDKLVIRRSALAQKKEPGHLGSGGGIVGKLRLALGNVQEALGDNLPVQDAEAGAEQAAEEDERDLRAQRVRGPGE